DWCRSLLILNCQELAAQQPLRPINWCSRLLKMTPRRALWRACHKPTFSRRRKPHAPPFDPVRRRARKPTGVAGHQG
ncbi:MAG: hypothetical protein EOM34_16920, partial [Clostridia bacterium]|nr:hypothetical protein [Clostridia bacterium]